MLARAVVAISSAIFRAASLPMITSAKSTRLIDPSAMVTDTSAFFSVIEVIGGQLQADPSDACADQVCQRGFDIARVATE